MAALTFIYHELYPVEISSLLCDFNTSCNTSMLFQVKKKMSGRCITLKLKNFSFEFFGKLPLMATIHYFMFACRSFMFIYDYSDRCRK